MCGSTRSFKWTACPCHPPSVELLQVLEVLPEHVVQDALSTAGLTLDDMLRALPSSPRLHRLAMQALDPNIQSNKSVHIHSLSAHAFRRACAAAVAGLTDVTALSLRGQMTTSHHLARLIAVLPRLTKLDLHDSGVTVTGEVAAALSQLSCLDTLDLSHNMIEDSLIRVASVLPRPPHLRTLNIDKTISRGWHLHDLAATVSHMPELHTLSIGTIDLVWTAPRRADRRQLRVALAEFVQAMKEVATLRRLTLNFAEVACNFGETAALFRALGELTDLEHLSISVAVRPCGALHAKDAAFVTESLVQLRKLSLLELNLSGSIDFDGTMLCSTLRDLPALEELLVGGDMEVHDTNNLATTISDAALLTSVILRPSIDMSPKSALALATQLAAITRLQSVRVPIIEWGSGHAAPLQAAAEVMASGGRVLTFDWLVQPSLLGPEQQQCANLPVPAEAASGIQSVFLTSNCAVTAPACLAGIRALTSLELRLHLPAAESILQLLTSPQTGHLTQLRDLKMYMGVTKNTPVSEGHEALAIQSLSQLQKLTALALTGCGSTVGPIDVSSVCGFLPQLQKLELQWASTSTPTGFLDVTKMLSVQTLILESAPMPDIVRFSESIVLLARLRCLGMTECYFDDEIIADAYSIVAPLMQQHVKLAKLLDVCDDVLFL